MADYTGNIQDSDVILVANGATNFKVTALILAEYINSKTPTGVATNILDTDLFLIADGATNYKINAADLAEFVLSKAPAGGGGNEGQITMLQRDPAWAAPYVGWYEGHPDQRRGNYPRIYSNGHVAVNRLTTAPPNQNKTSDVMLSTDSRNFSMHGRGHSRTDQSHRFAYHKDWPAGKLVGTVTPGTSREIFASSNHGVSADSTEYNIGSGLGGARATNPPLTWNAKANGQVMVQDTDGYMFLSEDYGNTWTKKGMTFDFCSGGASEDPDSDVWVICTVKGIYRSDDAGENWNPTTGAPTNPAPENTTDGQKNTAALNGEGGQWAAIIDTTLYYSLNDGVSWTVAPIPTVSKWAQGLAYNTKTKVWAAKTLEGAILRSENSPAGPWTVWSWLSIPPLRGWHPHDAPGTSLAFNEVTNELFCGGYCKVSF